MNMNRSCQDSSFVKWKVKSEGSNNDQVRQADPGEKKPDTMSEVL